MNIAVSEGVYELEVLEIEHFTDRLFSFSTTRPQGFRFRSGEFAMISVPLEKPIYRAYSVASPAWGEQLDFFSIKVSEGPLTSILQKIQPGDKIWMRRKSTGTLVLDALKPKQRLFLLSTGTGIAPFASIIRDPESYEKFAEIYLLHTCREVSELTYGKKLIATMQADEILDEIIGDHLHYYGTTTRETSEYMGRITTAIESGQLYRDLGIEALDGGNDAAMICGGMAMLQELQILLQNLGFQEGSNARPGDFVIEKAFAE